MKIIEAVSNFLSLPTQFSIGIVASRFNSEVTSNLVAGALERLQELKQNSPKNTLVWVPGAVEIPLTAQRLAQTGKFDAVIALGAVIRGETSHYDYVCSQVSDGCLKVSLQNNLPVIFGVLTTENEEQAFERCGGKHGHKGKEAVDAALAMILTLKQVD